MYTNIRFFKLDRIVKVLLLHTFNSRLSRTTQMSQYQKGKTNLDFTKARDSEWQWYQLGHMQVCTSLQTDNHASTPPLSFFIGRMPFLPLNHQRQSSEGKCKSTSFVNDKPHPDILDDNGNVCINLAQMKYFLKKVEVLHLCQVYSNFTIVIQKIFVIIYNFLC